MFCADLSSYFNNARSGNLRTSHRTPGPLYSQCAHLRSAMMICCIVCVGSDLTAPGQSHDQLLLKFARIVKRSSICAVFVLLAYCLNAGKLMAPLAPFTPKNEPRTMEMLFLHLLESKLIFDLTRTSKLKGSKNKSFSKLASSSPAAGSPLHDSRGKAIWEK